MQTHLEIVFMNEDVNCEVQEERNDFSYCSCI